jgi:hypothetical protein
MNLTDYRHDSSPFTNIRAGGRSISFKWQYRWGQPYQDMDFDLTVSEDNESLTGAVVSTDLETGRSSVPMPVKLRRRR